MINNKRQEATINQKIGTINQKHTQTLESIKALIKNRKTNNKLIAKLTTIDLNASKKSMLLDEIVALERINDGICEKTDDLIKKLEFNLKANKVCSDLLRNVDSVISFIETHNKIKTNLENKEELARIINKIDNIQIEEKIEKQIKTIGNYRAETNKIREELIKEADMTINKGLHRKTAEPVLEGMLIGNALGILDTIVLNKKDKLVENVAKCLTKLFNYKIANYSITSVHRDLSNYVEVVCDCLVQTHMTQEAYSKIKKADYNKEPINKLVLQINHLTREKIKTNSENNLGVVGKEFTSNYQKIVEAIRDKTKDLIKNNVINSSQKQLLIEGFDWYLSKFILLIKTKLNEPIEIALPRNMKQTPTKNDTLYVINNIITVLNNKINEMDEKYEELIMYEIKESFNKILKNIESSMQHNSTSLYIPTSKLIRLNKGIKCNETQEKNTELIKTLNIIQMTLSDQKTNNTTIKTTLEIFKENVQDKYKAFISPLLIKINNELTNPIISIYACNNESDIINALKEIIKEIETKLNFIANQLLLKMKFNAFKDVLYEEVSKIIESVAETFLIYVNTLYLNDKVSMEIATQIIKIEFELKQTLELFKHNNYPAVAKSQNNKHYSYLSQLSIYKRFMFMSPVEIGNELNQKESLVSTSVDPQFIAVYSALMAYNTGANPSDNKNGLQLLNVHNLNTYLSAFRSRSLISIINKNLPLFKDGAVSNSDNEWSRLYKKHYRNGSE